MLKFPKGRKGLEPVPPGVKDLWAVVHVRLTRPWPIEDEGSVTLAHGYYVNLGLSAAPERVAEVLRAAITDGEIDWQSSEWREVEVENLDAAVRKRIVPVLREGVWYKSGRGLYSDNASDFNVSQEKSRWHD